MLTLKETMKPPFVHSSTIGFRIFGTWSISMDKFPLPDCILCSDCINISFMNIRSQQSTEKRRTENLPFFVLVRKSRLLRRRGKTLPFFSTKRIVLD